MNVTGSVPGVCYFVRPKRNLNGLTKKRHTCKVPIIAFEAACRGGCLPLPAPYVNRPPLRPNTPSVGVCEIVVVPR